MPSPQSTAKSKPSPSLTKKLTPRPGLIGQVGIPSNSFTTSPVLTVNAGPPQILFSALVDFSAGTIFIGPQGETVHLKLQNILIGDHIKIVLQKVSHG